MSTKAESEYSPFPDNCNCLAYCCDRLSTFSSMSFPWLSVLCMEKEVLKDCLCISTLWVYVCLCPVHLCALWVFVCVQSLCQCSLLVFTGSHCLCLGPLSMGGVFVNARHVLASFGPPSLGLANRGRKPKNPGGARDETGLDYVNVPCLCPLMSRGCVQ